MAANIYGLEKRDMGKSIQSRNMGWSRVDMVCLEYYAVNVL